MTPALSTTAPLLFVVILLALAVAVPLLNLALPPTSPLHVPTYVVALLGKYLCYALLALSLDLIWGYCGILSLGHGAFFALGGYAMGMYLMRQIGTRGVYANPVLPDFMVFLNWQELPVTGTASTGFAYAMLMVLLVPGVLAFVFGWFAFRCRVTGVYLSIITQALTYALLLAFFRNDMGFGGNNGLTDFKDILGFNVQAAGTRAALFAISCVALALALHHRAATSSPRSSARCWSRSATPRAAPASSATASSTTSSSSSRCRPAWPASPARSTCRRSASSTRRVRAGELDRGGDLGRGRRPRHADRRGARRGRRQLRQDLVHQRRCSRPIGCSCSAACSSSSRCSCRKGIVGTHRSIRGTSAASRTRRAPTPQPVGEPAAGGVSVMEKTTSALLYLDGVTVSFDGFQALNDLSLAIEPGEMRAIIGPNGAGKTTMMDIITGKTRPDKGDVFFDGGDVDLTRLDEAAIAELGIGRKFQKPTVFESHTVEDNLELALKADRRARRHPVLARQRRGDARASTGFSRSSASTPLRDRLAGSLSHGQKQWLEIGMLLAQEPKLLLVDEPVAGMTDAETRQTAELLKEINRDPHGRSWSSTTWPSCASSASR